MSETKQHDEIDRIEGVKYVSRAEACRILDRQARKYHGMSGEEFVRKWRAGEIEDPDRSDVLRVAMLIPLTEP
jgi:hypothetical protein